MNAEFWIIAALLLALALLILIWPLLKNTAPAESEATQPNLKIARRNLTELKQQLREGLLTPSQFDEQYMELQLTLNDDLRSAAESADRPLSAGGRWAIPVIVLILPLLTILLYFHLGDPDALTKAGVQSENQKTAANMQAMVAKIIARLKENPGDVQGWMLLGRTYVYLEQYPQAVKVFAKLNEIQPDNADVLLNYASSLAMSRNGQLSGEPSEMAFRAVKLEPENKSALWMAAMAKAEAGDFRQSLAYLQTLAGLLNGDPESLQKVRQFMDEIGARQGQESGAAPVQAPVAAPAEGGGLTLHVSVDIDAAVKAKVKDQQTVFVYVQALNGPKMPLAIVRKQVADLPATLDLNDAMAMQPNLHLSDFKQLKIIARVSQTGNAITQAGDFIGGQELDAPADGQSVSVLINQEVK